MKTISLSVQKNMLLAIALSASSILLSEQSHAQKNSPETATVVSANAVIKRNTSVSEDASKDLIRIQNNNGAHGIARIYSQSGKKINESILESGVNAIDISSLCCGEYIICVTLDGGKTYNQQFIKE